MNGNRKDRFVKVSATALVLSTAVLLMSGAASAKERKIKSSDQAQVVAHIALSGLSPVDMAMKQNANDKYYLYIQHTKEQGISIIEITKPSQPKTVGVIPWPDQSVSSRMNLTGDLGIVSENASLSEQQFAANEGLVLWDLSDPVAPRVVQKFSGVIKWLEDDRNFIYVLNGDGLWIVAQPPQRHPEPNLVTDYDPTR